MECAGFFVFQTLAAGIPPLVVAMNAIGGLAEGITQGSPRIRQGKAVAGAQMTLWRHQHLHAVTVNFLGVHQMGKIQFFGLFEQDRG